MIKFLSRKFSKIVGSSKEALKDVKSGMTILSGGFGCCGVPNSLLTTLSKDKSIANLTMVSNNAGVEDYGIGLLLKTRQISKMIASYVGENKEFERQYLSGELEVMLTPQGTLAEKIRAGGSGIPLFATPTGVDTLRETGGFIQKYDSEGRPVLLSEPVESWTDDKGKKFLLEKSIKADVALIKAYKADSEGNLQFRKTARNFNQDMVKAAKVVIVETEHLVENGSLSSENIHTPSIFVDKIIRWEDQNKPIEFKTNSQNMEINDKFLQNPKNATRIKIASRAAKELRNNMYINLGIGIPTLVPTFADPSLNLFSQGENGILGLDGYPEPGKEDPDIIDPGKMSVKVKKSASFFSSSESFAMIRGKHLDKSFLGAMEVAQNGDLANWIIPGKFVKGMGGAMDLVGSGSEVVVLSEHVAKGNRPKILKKCHLPLTGKHVVNRIITNLAVFDILDGGLVLREIAKESSLDEITKMTEASFELDPNYKSF